MIFIFSRFLVMSPRDQRSERSVGGGGKYHRDGEKMLEAKTSHLLEKAGKRFFKWLLYVLGTSIKDVSSNFSFLTPPTYSCLLFLLNSPI